ncbi:MAG: hypothetical protein ACRD59_09310, partial [Candidatus Acidiferrales bacterium]
MIQLLFFVIVGVGLLLLLLIALRRPPSAAEGGAGALVTAKHTLKVLQQGLLPAELIDRLFGQQDLEYVESIACSEIREIFMAERKRLALAWVQQVRRQIHSLKEFHTHRSRLYASMSRRTELAVALGFADLEFQCRILQLLLQVRGTYVAPRLVRRTAAAAAGLCAVLD